MTSCPVRLCFLRNAQAHYSQEAQSIKGDKKPQGAHFGYATAYSVGFDLRACIDEESLTIEPGERVLVPTGIAIEPLVENIAAFVYSRSGLGGLQGLVVAQGVGVIDPDYRGELKVPLFNNSKKAITIAPFDRIAQMIFQPAFQAQFILSEKLSESGRGEGGFGHSGLK